MSDFGLVNDRVPIELAADFEPLLDFLDFFDFFEDFRLFFELFFDGWLLIVLLLIVDLPLFLLDLLPGLKVEDLLFLDFFEATEALLLDDLADFFERLDSFVLSFDCFANMDFGPSVSVFALDFVDLPLRLDVA